MHIISSFRDPLSHFISSYLQNQQTVLDMYKSKFSYYIKVIKDNTNSTERVIKPYDYYNLNNFQTKFMLSSYNETINLNEAIEYMKTLFWFSIQDQLELSLKLLQCQMFGKVDEESLKTMLKSKSTNKAISKKTNSFEISANDIENIKEMISIDIQFYDHVVAEFMNRVSKYSHCLN